MYYNSTILLNSYVNLIIRVIQNYTSVISKYQKT